MLALCAKLAGMTNEEREVVVIPDGDDEMDYHAGRFSNDAIVVDNEGDIKTTCRDAVWKIFPDVCPAYLEDLATQHAFDHEAIISTILDQSERGKPVPRRQRVNLKRKRESEDVGERLCDLRKKYDNLEWRQKEKNPRYKRFV